ncbi:MAG: hypothetical protein LC745_01925 [Planctomycetia bacterium]|nr:hypothetical protein [Planctomycetia bacterium]
MNDDERARIEAIRRRVHAFAAARSAPPGPPEPNDAGYVLAMLCLIGALCCLGALAAVACAAPAPAHRAKPVPLSRAVEGGWQIAWGSSTGTCWLSPQGFWGCELGGVHWHGDWSVDGTTLTIRETRLDRPEDGERTYAVTLAEPDAKGISGEAGGGVRFRLSR